jgi:phosphatidylglycerophosphatase A
MSATDANISEPAVNRLSWWDYLATGFGSGFAPAAPGTWGTLIAMLFYCGIGVTAPGMLRFFPGALWLLLLTAAAVYIADRSLQGELFRNKNKDPGQIVIDEFAGFFATVIGHPVSLETAVLAFLLFRIFDITKPPPVRRIEQLPGGTGVVLDDVVAGLYANLALALYFLIT